jgi:dsRNA-specific ribonuclease
MQIKDSHEQIIFPQPGETIQDYYTSRVVVSKGNYKIVFYKKENDEKYSFFIQDWPQLTDQVLALVKTKRVHEKNIYYCAKGVYDKILELNNNPSLISNKMATLNQNPIITLSEWSQKPFKQSIETAVIDKAGQDHCPLIIVHITMPDGEIFRGNGGNQKEAKKKAAEEALKFYGI